MAGCEDAQRAGMGKETVSVDGTPNDRINLET